MSSWRRKPTTTRSGCLPIRFFSRSYGRRFVRQLHREREQLCRNSRIREELVTPRVQAIRCGEVCADLNLAEGCEDEKLNMPKRRLKRSNRRMRCQLRIGGILAQHPTFSPRLSQSLPTKDSGLTPADCGPSRGTKLFMEEKAPPCTKHRRSSAPASTAYRPEA
jgi:hypothetical protein